MIYYWRNLNQQLIHTRAELPKRIGRLDDRERERAHRIKHANN